MKYQLGFYLGLSAISTMTLQAHSQAASSVTVGELQCENVRSPMGVEEAQPRLSWQLKSKARGARQTAYQVLVASSPQILAKDRGDLWDSGEVKSSDSHEILYHGKPLLSRTQCFWKVCAWDQKAQKSRFSAPARWEMGLLQPTDWHGQWIGYIPPKPQQPAVPSLRGANWIWYPESDPLQNAPEATRYFRRSFHLETGRKVSQAQLRIAADNTAKVFVNGKEVGQSHDSWKVVQVFDIGSHLVSGTNTIAIAVTNEGTAAGLATRLNVDFADGAPLSIITDSLWKSNTDEAANWSAINFEDSGWRAAQEVARVGEEPWGKVNDEVPQPALPAPYLRRNFEINGKVRRATAYIVGLGYYELSLNGKKVGNHELDPGWTRYDRRSLYVVHDVTSYLKKGANAVGIVLGTGHYDDHVPAAWDFDNAAWRTHPKMLLELRVDFEDGRSQTITSDGAWKASTGPVVFDSISAGEIYDARLEIPGWDTPQFIASTWSEAQVVEPVQGQLTAQISPPIRVTETIKPVKVTAPKPGVWLFDLGQNIAGIPQLRVNGPAGTKVVMKCAEKLHPDGTLDASTLDKFVRSRNPNQEFQTDTYILKGDGPEVWNPQFTYHGFQYVEVTGLPGRPTTDNLRGLVMHTDFEKIGRFESSNLLFNEIQSMSQWSYRNNFHSIPTDCPQREKNGWTGDAHLAAEMGLYNFDGEANYEKWLDDIADAQHEDGSLEGIIPTSGWGIDTGPAWDSVYPLLTWYIYEYKGSKSLVKKHYANIRRYVDYLTTKSKSGIVEYGLSDWVPAKTQTGAPITSTAYYYVDAGIVSKMAGLLGYTEDQKKYADLAASIKTAFNARFFHSETGLYDNGSITSLSCALYQGLVEPENKVKVLENLVAEIKKQDYLMDVGILGAKYVLNVLADNGRIDVAYQMLQQRSFPSYGYWVDNGATTLWEDWRGAESLNHIMFGDVSAWFYKYLAGIKSTAPGFETMVIKPHVVGDLTSAKASYDSVRGLISSDWKIADGQFQLKVTVPANTSATIYVPAEGASLVTESGKLASKSEGIRFLRQEAGYAVFAVQSGSYRFSSPKK